MIRSPQQIAKRAIIQTCLSLRSALETTDHPQSAEVSRSILPWLKQQGVDDELDPGELDVLETTYGNLQSDELRFDCGFWRESARICAWALGMVDSPPSRDSVTDYRVLADRFGVVFNDVREIISLASLRPEREIGEYCAQTLAIWYQLAKLRMTNLLSSAIDRNFARLLEAMCPSTSAAALAYAATFVQTVPVDERAHVEVVYIFRNTAAMWLFGKPLTSFRRRRQSGDRAS